MPSADHTTAPPYRQIITPRDGCDFTIYDLIARNARIYAHKEAIVYDGRRTDFKTYKKLCDQYAAGLSGEGVAAGDRIAVLAGNCDDFLILCGAAAKIGTIVVPVNWRLGEEEIAYILADTTPKLLVSGGEYGAVASRAASKAGSIGRHYSFRTDAAAGDGLPFRTLCRAEGYGDLTAVSGDPAYMIIHTAAVGGKPQGCLLSQGNMIAVGLQIAELLQLAGGDCHLCILPLFHIGGLAMTLATMHQGGKNVIVDRFDPRLVWKLIAKEQGTFFTAFPPILASILDVQEKEPDSFAGTSLRRVCGMDSPETLARFFRLNPQAAFYSLYGQTEAMPVSGCNYQQKPGSIGPPAILTRVAILDDLDREVAPGTPGEICVRSPAVFRGYWNRSEETAFTFRNGWHHTGDLGRCDEEGYLWYAGRKPEKELIEPGGENV
ncbi:MAG: AMP-dependent synthetase [Thermodesulfobacteriota bacterium]|nr:AMP-dependent synthetase [Thermodesulfobacteriota bacterium]